MKNLIPLLALFALCLPSAPAAEPVAAGPLGGRLLNLDGRKAEFFVEPDRTVVVALYDNELRPVAPAGEVVTATAAAPAGKVTLAFSPNGGGFKSTAPLPAGEGYLVVLQIRPTAEGKPKNFRIPLLTHACAECGRVEYACTCGH